MCFTLVPSSSAETLPGYQKHVQPLHYPLRRGTEQQAPAGTHGSLASAAVPAHRTAKLRLKSCWDHARVCLRLPISVPANSRPDPNPTTLPLTGRAPPKPPPTRQTC